MRFFTKYVLDRGVNDYKTPVEKDWMYVAKREYRYDVNVRAAADGAALGILACMGRMYMLKKFIWWPFAPVFAATYLYRQRQLFVFHNKKFFDMCNVGEQYEVGFARLAVLKRCNGLLDREDFLTALKTEALHFSRKLTHPLSENFRVYVRALCSHTHI